MRSILLCILLFSSAKLIGADTSDLDQKNNIPYSFCEIYDKYIDSIIHVKVYYDSKKDENASSIYEYFFGPTYSYQGGGSGFIYSGDGYILTNAHVVSGGNTFKITFYNGEKYDAVLIDSNEEADVAVLKIEENNLPFLTLEDSDNIIIGEWVAILANPCSNPFSISVGIIAGKNRKKNYFEVEDFIQIDGASNYGISGSPVLNMSGNVIGMNSLGFGECIGFAISSNIVKKTADLIIKNGKIFQNDHKNFRNEFVNNQIEKDSGKYFADLKYFKPNFQE
ncbi:MAG: putative serine protease HtrA [Candidatus Anoxychlamydiales bacterium]|nr:putative serine protease HtrA [Candidatus Anoxychlamydiales bacterium]NGX41330.1 putative serine protease HtrA [Candidatus Anoxychlamydiales bacterium]HEU64112.1 trypsin-like serine protease [Chlamydiota bacterium]